MSPTEKILRGLKDHYGINQMFNYKEVSDYLKISPGLSCMILTSKDSDDLGLLNLEDGWFCFKENKL